MGRGRSRFEAIYDSTDLPQVAQKRSYRVISAYFTIQSKYFLHTCSPRVQDLAARELPTVTPHSLYATSSIRGRLQSHYYQTEEAVCLHQNAQGFQKLSIKKCTPVYNKKRYMTWGFP